jgi:uncharacterized protein involved in exopolysaccharide biosynthesis
MESERLKKARQRVRDAQAKVDSYAQTEELPPSADPESIALSEYEADIKELGEAQADLEKVEKEEGAQ